MKHFELIEFLSYVKSRTIQSFIEYICSLLFSTHFSITRSDGSITEGSEDDGENSAGQVLLHLLQAMNISSGIVVVTRWFGRIQIGADRFHHYKEAAAGAVTLAQNINGSSLPPTPPLSPSAAAKKSVGKKNKLSKKK